MPGLLLQILELFGPLRKRGHLDFILGGHWWTGLSSQLRSGHCRMELDVVATLLRFMVLKESFRASMSKSTSQERP
jgi:hypothetical protein